MTIFKQDFLPDQVKLSEFLGATILTKLESSGIGTDVESARVISRFSSSIAQTVGSLSYSSSPDALNSVIGVLGGKLFKTPDGPKDRNILLQLDLDQVSAFLGEPRGTGLLEVYLKKEDWGNSIEMPVCLASKEGQEYSILEKALGGDRENNNAEIGDEHLSGENWGWSSFSEEYSLNNPIYLGEPTIVGKAVPQEELIRLIADEAAVDLDWIEDLQEEHAWDEDDYDDYFFARIGQYEPYVFGASHVLDGWLPVLSFAGPVSAADPIEDDFVIFFRQQDSGHFEYKAVGHRWTY